MSHPLRVALLVLLPAILCGRAEAQCVGTPIGGTLANTTLTLAASPYCVVADLSLINVVIEPGVVVQVDGDFTIHARTGVAALGTPGAPILFTSTTCDWNGIRFVNAAPTCAMDWCIVEKADQPGITVVDSLPRITNCTVRDNHASVFGGGMRIEVANGHFALKGCTISGNTSTTHGGGMYIRMDNGFSCVLTDCQVLENVSNPAIAAISPVGGGIYFAPASGNLVLAGCTLSRNIVSSNSGFATGAQLARGAGLYAVDGNVAVVGCEVSENWARGYDDNFFGSGRGRGAGVYFVGAGSVLDVRNSRFLCNSALVPPTDEATGSSIYLDQGTALITNCTFARNGVVWPGSPDPTLYNWAGTATVTSCIFYWNNPGGSCASTVTYGAQIGGPGTTTVAYSDVQGGFPGTGNPSIDPVFFSSGNPNCDASLLPDCGTLDVRLVFPGSPCVDTGSPAVADRDVCFPPSQGGVRNDMGFTGGPQACPDSTPALVTSRTCGSNVPTYTAGKVILGQMWTASVACPPGGQPVATLSFSFAPLSLQLPNGSCFLTDPRLKFFSTGASACPLNVSILVPNSTALLGCALYTQAGHVGGGSFALSNAQDLVIGTF